jgi:hypothetical protein
MTKGIVIQSFTRRVVLQSPPHPGLQFQRALIPEGATDQQVLEWTRGWLSEAAWEEPRERLSEEAGSLSH